ncbi:MAG: hypothetical protein K940chlam5_00242 [Candidatus Anoxychlamydiales bacterium]|nr:hypothetical protein [Candidatus Anoxychlamydiales bacterium]
MTSSTSSSSSKPPLGAGPSSEKPEGSSVDPSLDTTAEKTTKVQSEVKLTNEALSATLNPNETEISLKEVVNKRKKRKIGGQKIKEITAKKPGEKKPVDVSPTEWETLTKVTDTAKKIFWPEKTWKKALWSPVSIFAGAGLALAHGAKTITHGVKHLKANTSKKSILPPFLHNINPFRAQHFVELTEDEKDKFCEKMDKAWKSHQEKYNKGKEDDKKILSEDVVKWGFEIPQKKGGRFGFRIVYRIPDKNGKYVKGQDKNRKYKVDKDGIFEYKMKYLFWGKLDLDDLDDIFVESTSIVEDWDNLKENDTERVRLTAPTLAELKKTVKDLPNADSIKETKAKDTAKQNCWLHTTVQRALHNKKFIAALEDEKRLNKQHVAKISAATIKARTELRNLKAKTKNLIECIKKCIGKPSDEQYSIIEEKYDDTKSYAEKIRKDLGFKETSQEDSDDAYKVLEDYLIEIGAIDIAKIKVERKYSTSDETQDETLTFITIPVLKKGQNLDLTKSIENYFIDKKESPVDDGSTSTETIKIPKKPPAITVKISDKAILDNIPLNLKYEDDKFVADDKGEFEFNYADIHEGDRGGGHYFSIYKEKGVYYIYDNTKDLSDTEALKIDEVALRRHLKNAKTIVYEQNPAASHAEDPAPSATEEDS